MRTRLILTVLALALPAPASAGPDPAMPQATPAQTRYLVGCGGCHGIQGVSQSRVVPQLRDQVGYFLCTEAGRGYAVRLPNVAFADMNDADLAEMMNFVMFGLGGQSSRGGRPYTAAEVGQLRKRPLVQDRLLSARTRVVAQMPDRCRAVAGAYTPEATQLGPQAAY